MAAIGAGDGRSVMVHLCEIRHGDPPLAAPGGIGRARRSVEHDTGEVRVDGAVPSRRYSRASRAKRRRPGGARPSVALPGDDQPLAHPALGLHKVQNAPFKLSETPATNHLPSPLIGQHTREIVEGLLGYSHEELRAGFADGTLWPTKRARLPYMEEMLQ